MQIRRALPAEAEACWHIRNQAIRHGCRESYDAAVIAAWTPDTMPQSYRNVIRAQPFFVAVDTDDQPVATGFLDVTSGSVEAIFTLPAYTGQGLASRIIDAIKSEARARGFPQLTLFATPNARNFYQKQGFHLVRECFYPSALAHADLRCFEMIITLR